MTPTYAFSDFFAPTTTAMSSASFRQQITQLLSDLTRCYELCEAIQSNRRLGSTHDSFDRLQDGIRSSARQIQLQFDHLRHLIGSKMDQGDEEARLAMDISVRDTQMEVRAKLFDIAYKKRDDGDAQELPGFRALLRRWRMIQQEVTDTLQNLAQRLEKKSDKKDKDDKKKAKKDKKAKKGTKTDTDDSDDDDVEVKTKRKIYRPKYTSDKEDSNDDGEDDENEAVTIRLKDLDTLLSHMKNCWVEKWVGGEILYVNKFDTAITQWERPNGYIKRLPQSPSRSSTVSSRDSRDSRRSSGSSWDSPRRRRTSAYVSDTWSDPSGW